MRHVKQGMLLVATYLVCWQLVFVMFFGEFNLPLSCEMFLLSWTFQSLEMGVFVWLYSLILFLVIVPTCYLFAKKWKLKHNAN